MSYDVLPLAARTYRLTCFGNPWVLKGQWDGDGETTGNPFGMSCLALAIFMFQYMEVSAKMEVPHLSSKF